MVAHVKRNAWKYATLATVGSVTALNWPLIKATICAILCAK